MLKNKHLANKTLLSVMQGSLLISVVTVIYLLAKNVVNSSTNIDSPNAQCQCILDQRCVCQMDTNNGWANVQCIIPLNGGDKSFPKIFQNDPTKCKIHDFKISSENFLEVPHDALANLNNCAGYGCQIAIESPNMTIDDFAFTNFHGYDGDTIAITAPINQGTNQQSRIVSFNDLDVSNLQLTGFQKLNLSGITHISQLYVTDFNPGITLTEIVFPNGTTGGKLDGLEVVTDRLRPDITRLPLKSLIIRSHTSPVDDLIPSLHTFNSFALQYIQLNCYEPNLIDYPFSSFQSANHLDLGNNTFRSIPKINVFQQNSNPYLSLLLGNNSITKLLSNSLTNLFSVNLNSNPIVAVEDGAFNGSSNVYLWLADGASVSLDAFDGIGQTIGITFFEQGKMEITKSAGSLKKSSAGLFLTCWENANDCASICPSVTKTVCDTFDSVTIDRKLCTEIQNLC